MIDIGETPFVGFDDLVGYTVQVTTKQQVVKCVSVQMLQEANPCVFVIADVLKVVVFATLKSTVHI